MAVISKNMLRRASRLYLPVSASERDENDFETPQSAPWRRRRRGGSGSPPLGRHRSAIDASVQFPRGRPPPPALAVVHSVRPGGAAGGRMECAVVLRGRGRGDGECLLAHQ